MPPRGYVRASGGGGKSSRILTGLLRGARTFGRFKASEALGDAYSLGSNATPDFYEMDSSDPATAAKFHALISAAKQANKFGASVYVYDVADYGAMRVFLSASGQSGFGLKPDGDLVSVFSTEGAGHAATALGVQMGATKADAFDTVLPSIYAAHGFRVVSRVAWNDGMKPSDWDYSTYSRYKDGRPDVVYLGV